MGTMTGHSRGQLLSIAEARLDQLEPPPWMRAALDDVLDRIVADGQPVPQIAPSNIGMDIDWLVDGRMASLMLDDDGVWDFYVGVGPDTELDIGDLEVVGDGVVEIIRGVLAEMGLGAVPGVWEKWEGGQWPV